MTHKKEYDSFIFTHIPKCGGTSFRKLVNDAALESGISKNEIYIPGFNDLGNDKNIDQLNEVEKEAFKKRKYKVIAAHSKFNLHAEYELGLQNPFYYTILRDPVKRFISHYHFFYFTLGYNNLKGVHLNDLSVEKLIFLIRKLANIQTAYLANFKYKKVIGATNLLKLAKYNLQYEYKDFGILHDINSSIESLNSKKPKWLSKMNELPLLNSSGSNKVKCKNEILELIKDENQSDFELIEFGNFLLESRKLESIKID